MFRGSIPSPIQSIISEHVQAWNCSDIYVGCSGNFTVERVLHSLSLPSTIHGNDVTIYSSAIGSYLAKQPFRVELHTEHQEAFGWLADYLRDPADAVATIMLATRLTDGLGKVNPYYDRMRAAYRRQWPALHATTVERVRACELSLGSFYCGDIATMLEALPVQAGMICCPPSADDDYEKMFSKVEVLFDWDKPEYQELEGDQLANVFDRVSEQKQWLFLTTQRLDKFEPFLRGLTKATNRATPKHIYSSGGRPRHTAPHQAIAPVFAPRLGKTERLGATLSLSLLTANQFNGIRSQYLNAHIAPVQASLPVAVLVDGVVVGAYAISTSPNQNGTAAIVPEPNQNGTAAIVPEPNTYLLSDFPVAPTGYKYLSKLVIYALLSAESKLLIEHLARKRIRALVTTAFTKRPVSMKYRGLFEMISRKPHPDPEQGGYMVNYWADLGKWNLAQAFDLWTARYGTFSTSGEDGSE